MSGPLRAAPAHVAAASRARRRHQHGAPPERSCCVPAAFAPGAENDLGNSIEVVSGREEARLIYLGVAHGVPDSPERRLVIDIAAARTHSPRAAAFHTV